ncbi:MAG: winged helix-turn-helix domain-containing protein [Candidatus Helarchaeota archaeon]
MINQSDIRSIAIIGFDTLSGPVLRYKKQFDKTFSMNLEENLTSFYLMFNGGSVFKPKVIHYDDFKVYTFMNELDLYCFFLKKKPEEDQDYQALKNAVPEIFPTIKKKKATVTTKEKMQKILQEQAMTVRDLRKHFRFNTKTVQKYLKELEEEGIVERKGKAQNRAIIWGIK